MLIGIIDSGKGGLAVAEKIKTKEDQLILIMDQGYFPYGNKSKEFLLKRAYYLTDFLVKQGVEFIVIACNTLSIYAYPFLKNCFSIPILGVFDYFQPYLTKEYTLIGSKTTIAYAKAYTSVQTYDGTEFIEAIEKKKDIEPFILALSKIQTKAFLLGCTHFLVLDSKSFPFPTIEQISLLKRDIEGIRKKLENSSF